MRAALILSVLIGTGASADDTAVIDLTGLKIQDGLDQFRSSNPDFIDPATSYDYVIEGKVVGSGIVFGILFPNPTDLGDVLDTFEPGLSDQLVGTVENPGGTHPVGIFDQSFEGMQNLAGIDVTFAATLSAGIDENDFIFFAIDDVVLDPSFLVGDLEFTEGTVTVTATPAPCYPDFNGDGLLNILDFVAFQAAFEAADPNADCNGDTFLNILDFVCFQAEFSAGCE